MILVPTDNPGFNLVRPVPVMGHDGGPGHCEIRYEDCRVPAANLLGPRQAGFVIAQDRLGPGRIHHCMRAIGSCERAIEMMCRRANEREAFGGEAGREAVRPGLHRQVADRDRAGAPADPDGRLADGHLRQEGGAARDLDDQGRGRERGHGRARPRDPGPRLARDVRRHAAGGHVALLAHAQGRRRPRRGPQDGRRPARAQPLGEREDEGAGATAPAAAARSSPAGRRPRPPARRPGASTVRAN